MIFTPDDFPTARSAASKVERFDAAVRDLAEGIENGSIRNTVLKDAKFTLSNAVDKGWDIMVSEPFFWAGRFEGQPEDVNALHRSISMLSLHDLLATSRKLERTKATGPAVDAMRAYVAETLPLAKAAADLKNKVVKGRAPSAGPAKPVNPNKIVRTCPCCFRQIAVVNGTMAHHGYERPGWGYQTASCPGIRFRPLEVSDEGLVYMIDQHERHLGLLEKRLADFGSITSLVRQSRNGKPVTISPDDPQWGSALRSHRFELEAEIRQTKFGLETYKERRANWAPVEDAAISKKT